MCWFELSFCTAVNAHANWLENGVCALFTTAQGKVYSTALRTKCWRRCQCLNWQNSLLVECFFLLRGFEEQSRVAAEQARSDCSPSSPNTCLPRGWWEGTPAWHHHILLFVLACSVASLSIVPPSAGSVTGLLFPTVSICPTGQAATQHSRHTKAKPQPSQEQHIF